MSRSTEAPLPQLPFDDFPCAVASVLEHLHRRHGMGLWLFTRAVGPDWVILHTEDHGYGVDDGDVLAWSDSFCHRMVDQGALQVAPSARDVPEYATAPIADQLDIGSYLGVPMHQPDGEFFGTLCAIDPEPADVGLLDALPEVALLSRLLMTLLDLEQRSVALEHRLAAADAAARTDVLCGIANRRGFDEAVAHADARYQRYGETTAVVSIDLDGFKSINDTEGHAAGDEVLRRVAEVLSAAVRDVDVVARVGGDEFAMLLSRMSLAEAGSVADRVKAQLAGAGIRASLGVAVRGPRSTMSEALAAADRRMYDDKRSAGPRRVGVARAQR